MLNHNYLSTNQGGGRLLESKERGIENLQQ